MSKQKKYFSKIFNSIQIKLKILVCLHMVLPLWQQKRMETPSDVIALINNSRLNGCWIFHQRMNKFYTPEEFENNWQSIVYSERKRNNFGEFKIVNPMFAVRLCAKWLDIANKRNQEILKKLENYQGEFKVKK